jgi:hypothetical protein
MRDALAPRSCRPKRDAERMSMRDDLSSPEMRIAMSSVKPRISVRSVASITPGLAGRIVGGSSSDTFHPSPRRPRTSVNTTS